MKRQSELTLTSPEETFLTRVQGFNKITGTTFFGLLEEMKFEPNFPPHRIFDGFTKKPSKSSNVHQKEIKSWVLIQ